MQKFMLNLVHLPMLNCHIRIKKAAHQVNGFLNKVKFYNSYLTSIIFLLWMKSKERNS